MPRRLTNEEFIVLAAKKHGGKYTYSLVKYVNIYTKVTIICDAHGEFEQSPHGHLSGKGCPKCGGHLRLTTEGFIERATNVHGVGTYDYSLVKYVNNLTAVTITCPKHGDFQQTPDSHLWKRGCPKCGVYRLRGDRDAFIAKAREKHGDRYSYDKTVCKRSITAVTITCPKHGDFQQTPGNHLSGHGCPKCADAATGNKLRGDRDAFIAKARKKHGDRYSYDKVVYEGTDTKVTITCPEHWDFQQTPDNHIHGKGCPECSESHGERAVRNILHEILSTTGVRFVQQYRIPECKHRFPLPFDFAVMERDVVAGLIEYHGEQHFVPMRFGGSSAWKKNVRRLESVQKRDAIKARFCADNNIPLLVLPYLDFRNIESRIERFLKKL